MRIPRSLSADDFLKILKPLGYKATRQAGSHIRLTTKINGEHHITIPRHNPIRVGTLSGILNDIGLHLGKTKSELIEELF